MIGWREWIILPTFGHVSVKAKIDTGARSSAIHAENIKILDDGRAAFQVYLDQGDAARVVDCIAPIIDQRSVRNSGGDAEMRTFVECQIQMANHIHTIELSLTRRVEMGFRMLLGRTAMRGRYLVDPGKSFLLGGAPAAQRVQSHEPDTDAD